MAKKTKILIFSALALLLAGLALLSFWAISSAKKPDKNGMFKIGNMYFEQQKEITPPQAQRFASKLNALQSTFLSQENRVFYSIVPDKSYYIQDSGYPVPDYQTALESISAAVSNMEYIDLTKALTLEDYYYTDAHWRQERLGAVLLALGDKMGFEVDINSFSQKSNDSFIGAYSRNLPKSTKPETIYWLTSDIIQGATCNVFTTKDFEKMAVYREDKLVGKTPYDLFLYGATPLIKIENPSAKSDKELIIFRDSYASSLAPLLISEYKTITLVDLRYMASQILTDYVTITNQDVLFLYSSTIAAQSSILR